MEVVITDNSRENTKYYHINFYERLNKRRKLFDGNRDFNCDHSFSWSWGIYV